MKQTLTVCAVAFLIASLTGPLELQSGERETSIDELEIRNTIQEFYIKGLQIRDFALIRAVCIPQAVLMSVGRDDKLHVTSLDAWSERFDPAKPPFQTLDYSILRIDTAGTAAQVKILFVVDENRRVTDFLNLLKLEGHWRVVNIIDF